VNIGNKIYADGSIDTDRLRKSTDISRNSANCS
jgi:hypothetical protein